MVVHQSVDPDLAVIVYEIDGVVQASGAPFHFCYVMVLRVRDGTIARVRDYVDPLGMSAAVDQTG